ncbi:PH domain-containing protein [Natrinema salifodinae]|uniref:PH domain-containing protein n=1 Tax=Natrinema salifodinae TaxID=1202768 RepID=A0A1I0Q8A7_9EURY|nr:PH domain-containing protein [Natrinema salifodinae]SEW22808.1 PH domain-containing protein [Natrinema salifodinae]
MASHDRRVPLDVGETDIGFQAGFGFYLGLVATGIAAAAGLLTGASTATLLGVLPSTVTIVAIVGHVLAKRTRGLPERIGRRRRTRLACYVPPAAFAALLLVPAVTPTTATTRFVVGTLVLVVLTGVAAFGLERMTRTRYVAALTADDPAASWPYHRPDFGAGGRLFTAFMVVTIAAGVLVAWSGNARGLVWALYGLFMLLSARFEWGRWGEFDPSDRWNPPELRAHEAGLVVDRLVRTTIVPWGAIEDVRLTDDELVLGRRRFGCRCRWFDIRCDRAAIDDPEAVLAGIERVRRPRRRGVSANREAAG